MADIAVKADDIWKSYEIHPVYSIWGKARRAANRVLGRGPETEPFYALREVAFEVEKGEAFGIIGPNGAGKSTLLKILGGVTAPTRGSITIGGRVAPLIELGAGFNPDLTGRENVFINGVVLGMTLREVRAKYDAIVEFAGLAEFMDTPVKKYSSGMLVRLGFAVAVHTEPDVLLVDEVLAVGDLEFRRKCFDRIRQARERKCTLLMVSHNLHQLRRLCGRLCLLDHGQMKALGEPEAVLGTYQKLAVQRATESRDKMRVAPASRMPVISTGELDVSSVRATCVSSPEETTTGVESDVCVTIGVRTRAEIGDVIVGIAVFAPDGARVCNPVHTLGLPESAMRDTHEICCRMPRVTLHPGAYSIAIVFKTPESRTVYRAEDAARFDVSYDVAEGIALGVIPVVSSWSCTRQ